MPNPAYRPHSGLELGAAKAAKAFSFLRLLPSSPTLGVFFSLPFACGRRGVARERAREGEGGEGRER